jgi:hypothetical protein
MSDLLKEAIADAKAVRETALQNAKMALEEAFTPQLKSMLSAKLKEEDLEEGEHEEGMHDDDEDEAEEGAHDDDAEEGRLSAGAHDDEEAEEGMHDDEAEEGRHEEDDEDDVEEGIIEIDGVKYAPIVAEKEDDDEDAEEGRMDEDNLDLESVIKELESELDEGKEKDDDDDDTKVKESTEETVEEEYEIDESLFEEGEEEELDEVDKSSGIGKGDNKEDNTDVSSGIGKGGQEKAKKMESVQAELKEYKEAVSFLKNKLHEVNILNAKLLFTNKLFKEYALDNNQKLRVVETFDRAQTTREIKLVYSTLCEQFGDNGSIVTKKSIKESASAKTGSTKPQKKIISEESNVADRFRQLAGIIK